MQKKTNILSRYETIESAFPGEEIEEMRLVKRADSVNEVCIMRLMWNSRQTLTTTSAGRDIRNWFLLKKIILLMFS